MKRFKSLIFFLNFCFFLATTGAVFAADTFVAKIGETEITKAELERIIGFYSQDRQKFIEQSPQAKVALVKRIVQGRVLSKLAREKGYEKAPGLKEQIDLMVDDFLATEYVKKEVLEKIEVTEKDMQLYYKIHREEFMTPETARARHILIRADKKASAEEKKKARERADVVLHKLKAGEDFAKLASEYSEDPGTIEKGGDLGVFSRGRMAPDFEEAVFSMKPGQISEILETEAGFHIVKMEEKKAAGTEPYEKVKERIRELVFNDMKKTKVQEFIDKALRDAEVELNYELLLSGDSAGQR